jgi:mono/diheme cytochrome c family protein
MKFLLVFASTIAMAAPTFNKDIAPILYQNCATCHRPGEVAPFSLLTYQDAAKRASLIATVTKKRYMPPWKPEPGYGNFDHVRALTDDQIAKIQEWATTGARKAMQPTNLWSPRSPLAGRPANRIRY